MQDLKSYDIKENKDIFNISKAGNSFWIIDSLLYNHDINRIQYLMILFVLIPEILAESYNQKYHLGYNWMTQNLEYLSFK